MKLHSPLRLLAALSLAGASFFAQAATADVTVAYQTTVDPAKVAQADGAYEKATGAKINCRHRLGRCANRLPRFEPADGRDHPQGAS